MSKKRFTLKFNTQENEYFIRDNFEEEEELGSYTLKWGVRMLNKLAEENEQLRTQLLICQQSKNDDGRFQVWEVPPIQKGTRISFTTNK